MYCAIDTDALKSLNKEWQARIAPTQRDEHTGLPRIYRVCRPVRS